MGVGGSTEGVNHCAFRRGVETWEDPGSARRVRGGSGISILRKKSEGYPNGCSLLRLLHSRPIKTGSDNAADFFCPAKKSRGRERSSIRLKCTTAYLPYCQKIAAQSFHFSNQDPLPTKFYAILGDKLALQYTSSEDTMRTRGSNFRRRQAYAFGNNPHCGASASEPLKVRRFRDEESEGLPTPLIKTYLSCSAVMCTPISHLRRVPAPRRPWRSHPPTF